MNENILKQNKFLGNNWIRAILINIALFVIIISISEFLYETNDDYAIATRLVDGYEYIGFVNIYLCRILIPLQKALEFINVFVLFQVICSFICFTIIIKTVIEKEWDFRFKSFALASLSVYMAEHYCYIQFTKTSGLLLVTGVLFLVQGIVEKKNWGRLISSFILIYLGICLRFANLYVAGAFAVVFTVFWVIENRKSIVDNGYFTKERILFYLCCIVLLAGTFVMNNLSDKANRETAELEEYRIYNSYRAAVVDYPVFADYINNPEGYEEIGLSENDIRMISSWYLDYDGAASVDNLKAIRQVYEKNNESKTTGIKDACLSFIRDMISKILELHSRGIHIIALITIAALGGILLKPKHFAYIIAVGCLAVVLYLYLHYLGRPLPRATYAIDLGATVWILYYWQENYFREKSLVFFKSLYKYLMPVLIVAVILVQIPMYVSYHDKYIDIKKSLTPKELVTYLEENDDILHVFPTGVKGKTLEYLNPMKVSVKGAGDNTTTFGGWGTKSPYVMETIYDNDIENVFGDIIDNENVLVVENKRKAYVEEYLNKWYGNESIGIRYEYVRTVADCNIWRVVSYEK